jgi:amidase
VDLTTLPIREIRRSIDSGSLTAESLLRACLNRIDAREADVGAWEIVDRDRALALARQLDGASAKGILHGIPMGVKDIIDVAGLPTRMGSPIFAKAAPALFDAASVALARTNGAIPLGKTVTTELAAFHPGKTRNPRNLEHTPGGSSSGSAAAVADGHVPLALGTQTAGSVVRPAAFCGVVGFKPSYGVVPRGGVKLQSDTLDTLGAFSRTVDDMLFWYAAMTGARSGPAPPQRGTRPLRISVITNWLDRAEMEMSLAVAQAADALASAGARVREQQLSPLFADAQNDQRTIQLAEMSRHYENEYHHHSEELSLRLLEMLGEGEALFKDAYRPALARAESVRKQSDLLFGDCDAWLMPSAPDAAPKGMGSTGDPLFNRLATVLHLPAINLPFYRNRAGMPLGIQLIGARHQDDKLLSTAAQVMDILQKHEDL